MPHPLFHFTSNPQPVEWVWVDSSRLNALLAPEYLVAKWTGGPRKEWFRSRGQVDVFLLPEIYIRQENGETDVMTPNGRHRIRWLISRGDREIPVALNASNVSLGYEIGLVLRSVKSDETIP